MARATAGGAPPVARQRRRRRGSPSTRSRRRTRDSGRRVGVRVVTGIACVALWRVHAEHHDRSGVLARRDPARRGDVLRRSRKAATNAARKIMRPSVTHGPPLRIRARLHRPLHDTAPVRRNYSESHVHHACRNGGHARRTAASRVISDRLLLHSPRLPHQSRSLDDDSPPTADQSPRVACESPSIARESLGHAGHSANIAVSPDGIAVSPVGVASQSRRLPRESRLYPWISRRLPRHLP
jgi:hypothetical protein